MFQIELIDIIYEIQPWFIEMSTRIEKTLLDTRQMFEWFKTNMIVNNPIVYNRSVCVNILYFWSIILPISDKYLLRPDVNINSEPRGSREEIEIGDQSVAIAEESRRLRKITGIFRVGGNDRVSVNHYVFLPHSPPGENVRASVMIIKHHTVTKCNF